MHAYFPSQVFQRLTPPHLAETTAFKKKRGSKDATLKPPKEDGGVFLDQEIFEVNKFEDDPSDDEPGVCAIIKVSTCYYYKINNHQLRIW